MMVSADFTTAQQASSRMQSVDIIATVVKDVTCIVVVQFGYSLYYMSCILNFVFIIICII